MNRQLLAYRLLFLIESNKSFTLISCSLCQSFNSLRSWRYCVGARLTFWRRSRVPKKGSRDEAVEIFLAACHQISLDYITTAPPPHLTRLLHNTARLVIQPIYPRIQLHFLTCQIERLYKIRQTFL